MSEMLPVFTIGHSTRSIVEFAALLQTSGVQLVVDIRSVPKSRTNPQYNLDALPDALAEFQVAHMRLAELGGLRKKSEMPADANALWRNQSFHNYADYALSEPFRSGLAHLLHVSAERRTAIMCAEAVWWRCHRRIVADYLIKEGRRVFHLMSETTVSAASMTPGAIEAADGLHYPAQELGAVPE